MLTPTAFDGLFLGWCLLGNHKGRPYYTRAWRADPSYSRDDPCGRPGAGHAAASLKFAPMELSLVIVRRFPQRLPLLTIMAKDDQHHVLALDHIQQFPRAGAQLLLVVIKRPGLTIRSKKALHNEFRLSKGSKLSRVIRVEMGTNEDIDIVRTQTQIAELLDHIFSPRRWNRLRRQRCLRGQPAINQDMPPIAGFDEIATQHHFQRSAHPGHCRGS